MRALTNSIAGTGLFALDVVVRVDGTRAKPSLGGSAGNVLSILGALGWNAAPIGTIGDDAAGAVLANEFADVGADLRLLKRSKTCWTPVVYQHQLADSESFTHRFTFACPACGRRRRPQWDDEECWLNVVAGSPSAGVFFLDRPTRMGVALARHYRESGALVVFEPSAFGDDSSLFESALAVAHVVKYADDRLAEVGSAGRLSHCVEIQTLGAKGLRLRLPSMKRTWFSMEAYSLPYIRDTAGAGDWCTAGMIFELFRLGGMSKIADAEVLLRALAFGQALSSLNCLTEGARGLLSAWSVGKIECKARELSDARLSRFLSASRRASVRMNSFALCESFADQELQAAPKHSGADVPCCVTWPGADCY